MNTRFQVHVKEESVDVIDSLDNTIIQSWDSFITDTGREIHPSDITSAFNLADELNSAENHIIDKLSSHI